MYVLINIVTNLMGLLFRILIIRWIDKFIFIGIIGLILGWWVSLVWVMLSLYNKINKNKKIRKEKVDIIKFKHF